MTFCNVEFFFFYRIEVVLVTMKSKDDPFPDLIRPTSAECALAVQVLGDLHGTPTPGKVTMPVLDSLVRTILSQNTTDKNSRVAFLSLKEKFPTWRQVYDAAGTGKVEESIRSGGLADIKARNIQVILDYLLKEHSEKCTNEGREPSYEWLRKESTEYCKAELSQHKGVGPKTVSCVLMFNLMRPEFPVDTHVWHIAKKMNWCPQPSSAEACYIHMNSRVPDQYKYSLHILLVEHGKRCRRCSKNGKLQLPEEGPCPLLNFNEQLQEFNEVPSVSSPVKKDYVPWYVKEVPTSAGKTRRATKVEIKTEGGVEDSCTQKAVNKKQEEKKKEIKMESTLEAGFHRIKKRKVLQHLDMQG